MNLSDTEIAREVEQYLASSTTPDSVKMMFVRFSGLCAIAEELDERVCKLGEELKREQDNHRETRSVLKTVHDWVQFYNQPQWRAAWESEIPKMIGLTHSAMNKGKHLELELEKIVRARVDAQLGNKRMTIDKIFITLKNLIGEIERTPVITNFDDDIPF